jgi:uncharacterized protein DUF6623
MILMRSTMWMHANSVQIEHPERLAWVQRAGFSTRVQSQDASHNWFHFAIPTPMIIDDSHFRAAAVSVRFRSPVGGGFVNALHVYDGDEKIAGVEHLSVNPSDWHVERVEIPGHPHIRWDVGISVLVGFAPDGREIEFSAAGCEFIA